MLVGAALLVLLFDWRAGITGPDLKRRAGLHARPVAALIFGALAYLLYKRVTTGLFSTALGPYADLRNNAYPLHDILRWTVLHLGELSLAVGIAPFAALLLLLVQAILGRTQSDGERAFVAVAVSGVVLIAIQVGAFATSTAHWVVERYSFYAMPLILLALVLWLARGAPRRPYAATVGSALVAFGLVVWLFHEFRYYIFQGSLPVNTLSLYALFRWSVHFGGNHSRELWTVGALAFIGAAAFVGLPRRVAVIALPVAVAVVLIAFSRPAVAQTRALSDVSYSLAGTNPTWVDDAVGRNANVAVLVSPVPDQYTASGVQLQTEFWNRSVARFYLLNQSEICPLPSQILNVNPATGELQRVGYTGRQASVPQRYLVVNQGTAVFGKQLVTGGSPLGAPLALYRSNPPLRLQNATEGLFADGWMGDKASYTQYAAAGKPGSVDVTLSRTAWGGPDKPGHVLIRYGRPVLRKGLVTIASPETIRWTIHSLGSKTFAIPATHLPLRIEVRIRPTFSPADYGQADARQLGAQPTFTYVPG
jgi:hypothetical protein